jgi:hypothetical protein
MFAHSNLSFTNAAVIILLEIFASNSLTTARRSDRLMTGWIEMGLPGRNSGRA